VDAGGIDGLIMAKHGNVPPPSVMFDEHPYSIGWRMGSGESHQLLWWEVVAATGDHRRPEDRVLSPLATAILLAGLPD
jgi:hypothetical protein